MSHLSLENQLAIAQGRINYLEKRLNERGDVDPLGDLRREALLVCGYSEDWGDPIVLDDRPDMAEIKAIMEATLGRCLLRFLNNFSLPKATEVKR